jgi:CheY-like chemotaxis protein
LRNTILVLDHDPTNQLLLFRILGGAGYGVASARDGAEALAKIAVRAPGLIVSSVDLPGKSGVEIAQLIKARPVPIPVILISSEAEPQPAAPADFVLGSPLDASKLLEAVRRLLSGEGEEAAAPSDRILVIDDDLAILNLLENLLAGEGYEVVTAACGREGLVAIEKDRPDLILLDVQMPGMSGFEVLSKIRETRGEVPVIMVTA